MARQEFDRLLEAGLLSEVEEIVVSGHLATHTGASRAEAYRWLRYEDPDPVARLGDGVTKLEELGVEWDAKAVDKAFATASKLGYSN